MADHVMVEALQHHQHMRAARHVRVDGDREHGIIVFAVHPVELVAPHLLDVARVDEAVAVRRRLDEHHRRQIVEGPARRDLDEAGHMTPLQRHHPVARLLRIVDLGPAVADPHVIGLVVVVHERVVVFDTPLEQQLVGDGRELPPGRHVAGRPPTRELRDELDALVQHLGLLLARHGDRVLVAVAMDADLVPGVGDGLHLGREGLDRMSGDEPGGLDPEPFEHPQQPRGADFPREQAAGDVVGRVLAAVRAEPAGHGVDIDAEPAQNLLGHGPPPEG